MVLTPTRELAEQVKDELNKYLSTPQARESIEQLLITRKTIRHLVEIAKGSAVELDKTVKPKSKRTRKIQGEEKK